MTHTLDTIANMIVKILKTDRWVFIVSDGDAGEGKSCITSQLCLKIARKIGSPFNYDSNMTYSRSELKKWIDGDDKGNHQKPEYSVILSDEIISMFFKRNWFDSQQIDGIELLNKCRDRHLCIMGNIPSFWDLDSAIYPLITFWIHVHSRGTAWLFQKDRNPFTTDKWHRKTNEKKFLKYHNPYKCKGFVCDIPFNDWTKSEKKKYYAIRNKKRVKTEGQRKKFVEERYGNIKLQRDNLLRFCFQLNPKLTNKTIVDISGLSAMAVKYIREGLR